MSKRRVESFTLSLNGFGAGPDQDINNPLGVGMSQIPPTACSAADLSRAARRRKLSTRVVPLLLAVFAVVVGCPSASADAPAASPRAEFVSVDMPHGSCRLSVESDGSARLQFGAAIRYVNIRQGTFNLSALRTELRDLVLPADRWQAVPSPRGGVVFSADGLVLPFSDEAFAQRVFQKAWDRRATATTDIEQRYEREIFRLCKLH